METPRQPTQHLDVLIIGAGLSGIAAGRYLTVEQPTKTFLIMEQRATSGGTWDLFRYPGVRSDSDLHTFGYAFKPWQGEDAIASGEQILAYLREAAHDNGLDDRIVYGRRVISADWSSSDAQWTVEVEDLDTDEHHTVTCRWLFGATGYYRYDDGYTPDFPGQERFQGTIVHPQHWPSDLDWSGQRVVVIGSGATAVTLVPALAERAAHVTMLQRTPSYVVPVPTRSATAQRFRRWFGDARGLALTRRHSITWQWLFWLYCRRFPARARASIRELNAHLLPDGYPVDRDFAPPYDPWDQRLCIAADGDLFDAIRRGDASVVTDRIAGLTETGVRVVSGDEIPADVIIKATGLRLLALGGMTLQVDGRPIPASDCLLYRGVLLSGVPNFAVALGYPNTSWTLKIDLACAYFCRLLTYLDEHGYSSACPVADQDLTTQPALYLSSGYVTRSPDVLPRTADRPPWQASVSYRQDVKRLRRAPVVDRHLRLTRAPADIPQRRSAP